MPDLGASVYPLDDDPQLPSDPSISATDPGDSSRPWYGLVRAWVGFWRGIYADYVVGHKPNPNAHHNRQHSIASAADHLFDADVFFGAHNVSATNAPVLGSHLTNKTYVDGQVGGARDPKESVRVATAAALPAYTRLANVITANANGALPNIDGVALAVGDGLLLKDGAAAADNGLYTVTNLGGAGAPWVLTRRADMDLSTETTQGAFTWAVEGATNGKLGWLLTTPDPIVLNVTAQTWTQIAGLTDVVAGAGLTKAGNQLDVLASDATITVDPDGIRVGNVPEAQVTGLVADLAAKLDKATFDANTILKADVDDTPAALVVPASTLVGRKAAGNIAALTPAEALALLPTNHQVPLNAGTWHSTLYQGVSGTRAMVASRMYAAPFFVPNQVTLSQLAINVTIVGAGGTVIRLGIYSDDGTGKPGARLIDAGTVAGDAVATPTKVIAGGQQLGPGLYWFVAVAQGGAPTVTSVASANFLMEGSTAAGAIAGSTSGYFVDGVAGALPDPFGYTFGNVSSNVPSIGLLVNSVP